MFSKNFICRTPEKSSYEKFMRPLISDGTTGARRINRARRNGGRVMTFRSISRPICLRAGKTLRHRLIGTRRLWDIRLLALTLLAVRLKTRFTFGTDRLLSLRCGLCLLRRGGFGLFLCPHLQSAYLPPSYLLLCLHPPRQSRYTLLLFHTFRFQSEC